MKRFLTAAGLAFVMVFAFIGSVWSAGHDTEIVSSSQSYSTRVFSGVIRTSDNKQTSCKFVFKSPNSGDEYKITGTYYNLSTGKTYTVRGRYKDMSLSFSVNLCDSKGNVVAVVNADFDGDMYTGKYRPKTTNQKSGYVVLHIVD